MKLVQRVNIILLPIIVGIYVLVGWLVYQALLQQHLDDTRGTLEREIDFFEQSLDFELNGVKTSLGTMLNTPEFIEFTNASDPEYGAYSFESWLYYKMLEDRVHHPGLITLQILRPDNSLWVSAQDGDPFAPQQVTNLMPRIARLSAVQPEQGGMLYHSGSNGWHYYHYKRFVPQLMQDDPFARDAERHLAVVISAIEAPQLLEQRLRDEFGSELSFDLVPTDSGQLQPMSSILSPEGDLYLTKGGSLYQMAITLPQVEMVPAFQKIRIMVLSAVVVLVLITFMALKLLIQGQIVNPINRLMGQVKQSNADEDALQKLDGNDEVSALNNAYMELIESVQHMAAYDSLTGLANRHNFQKTVDRQLSRALNKGQRVALLYIDLDNFKRVNDYYGHAVGDRLLQQFAKRLEESVRPTDSLWAIQGEALARLAGDEFALFLTELEGPVAVMRVAKRILGLFEHGFELDGSNHNVQVSIGIAMTPEDGQDAETLLRHADAAMYHAKSMGKNRFHFFTQELADMLKTRQHIEATLINAVTNDGFELKFMPIFDVVERRPVKAEVLVRCSVLERQGIGPDKFIPIAESSGLIKQIDLWVLEQSLKSLVAFQHENGYKGCLTINISAVELQNDLFPAQVARLLERYGLDPALIELEITETSLVHGDQDSLRILKELKQLGVGLALDDFGTGYTGFNQLMHYPVECLKIDRSFVVDIDWPPTNHRPMVNIILSLAELYELNVVAEGVETAEQMEYLRQCGCRMMQGYFLSKPLSFKEMSALAELQALVPLSPVTVDVD